MMEKLLRNRSGPSWGFLVFCLLLAVLLAPTGEVLASEVEILTPRPGATVTARNPVTHLVLRLPMEAEVRKVREASGKIHVAYTIADDGEYMYRHFTLPLKTGKNSFTILPDEVELEIHFKPIHSDLTRKNQEENLYLFHQSDQLPESCQMCHELATTETIWPVGIERQTSCPDCHGNIVEKGSRKHSTSINGQCLACHRRSVDPLTVGFPPVNVQKICLSCHAAKKSWLSRRYQHGPFRLGGCTLCHDPHGEDHPNQLWAEGSLEICIICHSDKADSASPTTETPYIHGIIPEKGCTACHDPHATNYRFVLHKETNKMCVGCHPAYAGVFRGHPVANHPVSGPDDKRGRGRPFSCASCHNPHGSKYPNLLIETTRGGRLCNVCH